MVGNKIVVVGGQADGKLVRETEVFDGQRWTIASDIPTPREHLGAASDGRYLYAVGGRNLSSDKNTAALERYDPASDTWTKLKNMPKTDRQCRGRVRRRAAWWRSAARASTSASDAVQAYEVKQRAWSQLPALPAARHGVAVDGAQELPLRDRRGRGRRPHPVDQEDVRARLRLRRGARLSRARVGCASPGRTSR